ncbi:uncharacterized protein A4U43_C07F23880 [Asparagus officinalis]|uniref:Uncharacterized protein n=1 Tax=Asparagus officinalis TaxID=4686 RepID=A0A5P1EHE7_ASPOF|nr:uncharacterized protein A4U43_C07F23880 [Asparagus officinalis]
MKCTTKRKHLGQILNKISNFYVLIKIKMRRVNILIVVTKQNAYIANEVVRVNKMRRLNILIVVTKRKAYTANEVVRVQHEYIAHFMRQSFIQNDLGSLDIMPW